MSPKYIQSFFRRTPFILLLFLTGCSYVTDFYIFNDTPGTANVTYEVQERSTEKLFVFNPKIVTFDSNMKVTYSKKKNTIKADLKTNTINCILEPGEGLWIGQDLNFIIKSETDTEILKKNLKYLTIITSDEKVHADQNNIVPLFKAQTKHKVAIMVK